MKIGAARVAPESLIPHQIAAPTTNAEHYCGDAVTKVIPFPITPADRPKDLIALQEALLATRNRFHGDKYGRFFHTTIFAGPQWSREELEYQQHATTLLTDALTREELTGFALPRMDGQCCRVNTSYWYSYGLGADAVSQGRLLFPVIDQINLREGVVGAPIYLDRNGLDTWLTKQIRSSQGVLPAATPEQIIKELRLAYDRAESEGKEGPNIVAVYAPVQKALRNRGLSATKEEIQDHAAAEEFKRRRPPPGKHHSKRGR